MKNLVTHFICMRSTRGSHRSATLVSVVCPAQPTVPRSLSIPSTHPPTMPAAFCPPTPFPLRLHAPSLSPVRRPYATFRVSYGPSDSHGLIFAVASPTSQTTPASSSGPTPLSEDTAQHRLSPGVRARTVVHVCSSGTLCTSSVKHDGVPFGSHVDFILDEEGRPVFLLANEATHTKNLEGEPRCSLFCQPTSASGQDGCRVTLVGKIKPLAKKELDLRDQYVHTHPHAGDALDFLNVFEFYQMDVDDVFFVGGYGVVSQWVDAKEFADAQHDPLAFDAPEIVKAINEKKGEELKRLCAVYLGVEAERCVMMNLDRLGFDLRVRDADGLFKEYRVAFREKVSNRFDVQSALVKAFQEAWERENGYDETWAGEDRRPTVLYYSPLLKRAERDE